MQLPALLRASLALLVVLPAALWPSTIAVGASPPPAIRITFANGRVVHSAPGDAPVHIHGVIRARGRGVVGAAITVEQAPPGGSLTAVGIAKSHRHGRFKFTLPPGGTRAVLATVGPLVSNLVVVKLATHVLLSASPHHVRARGRVKFSGHVLGLSGQQILIELQVRKHLNSYQTFRIARTRHDGSFFGHFRFAPGRARYQFRALIEHQAGFPYALSKSNLVSVRVR